MLHRVPNLAWRIRRQMYSLTSLCVRDADHFVCQSLLVDTGRSYCFCPCHLPKKL